MNELHDALKLTDDDQAGQQINELIDNVGQSASQMRQHCKTLDSYAQMLDSCRALLAGSQDLLGQLGSSAADATSSLSQVQEQSSGLRDSLDTAGGSLSSAVAACAQSYDEVVAAIGSAFDAAAQGADDGAESLRGISTKLYGQADPLEEVSDTLRELAAGLPDQGSQTLVQFCALLDLGVQMQRDGASAIDETATGLSDGAISLQDKRSEIEEKAAGAASHIEELQSAYDNEVRPVLDQLSSDLAAASDKLGTASSQLSGTREELSSKLADGAGKLDAAKETIEQASQKLAATADDLDAIHDKLASAMESGGIDKVKELLGGDNSTLATNLAAPVGIERKAVFASNSFGSSMAPLYATLALWVGSLLSVVLIKTNPNEKTLARCGRKPHLHEIFLGRFGLFALISLLQSTVMAVGNMLFLQVQVSDPVLYLVCFWISGLVFQFIMYTLVASFGNVGKAISVLLLIVQVTSSNGSYPLQLLPDFATILSPLMPATYVISAMRAAMFGVYQGDFWVYMGELVVFVAPMALIGLVLRRPFVRMNERFVEKTEKSKLI